MADLAFTVQQTRQHGEKVVVATGVAHDVDADGVGSGDAVDVDPMAGASFSITFAQLEQWVADINETGTWETTIVWS